MEIFIDIKHCIQQLCKINKIDLVLMLCKHDGPNGLLLHRVSLCNTVWGIVFDEFSSYPRQRRGYCISVHLFVCLSAQNFYVFLCNRMLD